MQIRHAAFGPVKSAPQPRLIRLNDPSLVSESYAEKHRGRRLRNTDGSAAIARRAGRAKRGRLPSPDTGLKTKKPPLRGGGRNWIWRLT
jgi:hypothetical protein